MLKDISQPFREPFEVSFLESKSPFKEVLITI